MLPNAQPKPRPYRLVKHKAVSDRDKIDREEKAKVKARSGGQCEVWETFIPIFAFEAKTMREVKPSLIVKRCKRRANENHHLIGGIGRRNRGKSILAAHRLHVCDRCHADITGKVLVPIDGTKKEAAATVSYERVK